MSAELIGNQMGKVVWKLRECMARRKITNNALAKAINMHSVSIARLRAQDLLPEIGNDRIEQIRAAIELISGRTYGRCLLNELVELVDEEAGQ